MTASIEIHDLTKIYRAQATPALNHLNLTIQHGMFGLLGKNGAGKSTLMKVLTTLTQPTTGTATICGIPLENKKEIRKIIGYLPQNFGFYPNMSVQDAMTYLALLSQVPARQRRTRIPELLEKVNLSQNTNTKLKSLSGGMLQRLGIAQALLNDPQVLIVDEPTAGLDPEERIRFRNLLTDFAQDRIVLLSTHIVSDIEATTNTIGILDQGRLIFSGTTTQLLAQAADHLYEIELDLSELDHFKQQYHISEQIINGQQAKLRFIASQTINGARLIAPTLEEGYLYLQTQVESHKLRR